ncbi:transposase [Amycolatopsis sp. NBC_00438]|uniref:transposase n=1 Tax=Amycolatopsis sp. NBC_00438 TaxID=2903558 RepID=UPI003FA47997
MVGRGEPTDLAWAVIEPPLPRSGGWRWRDHRQVINAILWKLRTGAPRRDLPNVSALENCARTTAVVDRLKTVP